MKITIRARKINSKVNKDDEEIKKKKRVCRSSLIKMRLRSSFQREFTLMFLSLLGGSNGY